MHFSPRSESFRALRANGLGVVQRPGAAHIAERRAVLVAGHHLRRQWHDQLALPDLRGGAPLQQGQGASLSERLLGEQGGTQTVTLTSSQLPTHTHTAGAVASAGNATAPGGKTWGKANLGRQTDIIYSTAAPSVAMSPQTSQVTGGGQPHNNMPPCLAVTFIIAMQGIFPQRP